MKFEFMTLDASKIVCEFLEVAVYGILYTRDIYPRGSFELKKKYGIPVQVRHFYVMLCILTTFLEILSRR